MDPMPSLMRLDIFYIDDSTRTLTTEAEFLKGVLGKKAKGMHAFDGPAMVRGKGWTGCAHFCAHHQTLLSATPCRDIAGVP